MALNVYGIHNCEINRPNIILPYIVMLTIYLQSSISHGRVKIKIITTTASDNSESHVIKDFENKNEKKMCFE